MTWSISASGTKEQAKAQLAQAKVNPESHEATEHGGVLELMRKLVDASPDGETISLSGNGHTDDKAQTTTRSTRLSVSFSSSKT